LRAAPNLRQAIGDSYLLVKLQTVQFNFRADADNPLADGGVVPGSGAVICEFLASRWVGCCSAII